MLIFLRTLSIILALILLLSIVIGFSVLIKHTIETRFLKTFPKKKKSKLGDLPSDAGVRELILNGQLQEATDLYRQFTGVDEFTARDAIEDIERELRLSNLDAEILDILATRGKAGAIQAYQDQTGDTFDDALRHVEKIEQTHK